MAAAWVRFLLSLSLVALAVPPLAAQLAPAPVTVFAAASLRDAMTEIGARFTAETRIAVRFSFASSAALARQIEQGAPADLFMSADVDWMDWAAQRRLVKPDSRIDLLGNRLVAIAAADSKIRDLALEPSALAAALGEGRLAVGAVASVPAGRYAKAALEQLGLWAGVKNRLAQTESVRAALVLVARGEAALGIVYASDAKAEPRVKIVATFSDTSHPPIVYPAALTAGAREGAARLMAYLKGAAARDIFTGQGFAVLTPASR